MVNLQEGLDLPWLHVMSVNFCIKNKILLGFPLSFKFYILLLRKQKDLMTIKLLWNLPWFVLQLSFIFSLFVFYSSLSSSLYFDKIKVFVHFDFVFSQRCLTLLNLGPYWLSIQTSSWPRFLENTTQILIPIIELKNICPVIWLIWSCEKLNF